MNSCRISVENSLKKTTAAVSMNLCHASIDKQYLGQEQRT